MSDNIVQMQSAALSNYKGYNVFTQFDRDGTKPIANAVYLGKQENYDNQGNYNNDDNSLIYISDNLKMSGFLSRGTWVYSEQEMIAKGAFSEADYKEYAFVKETTLKQLGDLQIHEVLFDVDVDMPGSGVPFRHEYWWSTIENDYGRMQKLIQDNLALNPIPVSEDWFYNNPETESIRWINFNPDSIAGGQYVDAYLDYDLIRHCQEVTDTSGAFMERLISHAKEYLIDIDTEQFAETAAYLKDHQPDMVYRGYDEERMVQWLTDLTSENKEMRKQRLFVDMDGTLAVFTPVDELETLYQKGYFLNQAPQENVVAAVKEIIKNNPEIEVNILSAYLSDSKYALDEKNQWLDQHLPEIDQAHRIFLPCGKDKKEYIPGGIRESDILLDDYTKNLNDWQPPARGIKLLNDINHTRGSWQHDRIRHDRNPDELADAIMDIMDGKRRVFDFSNQYQHINPSKVLCFDVETTGLNPNTDEIIQLSIMDGNGKTLFNDYVKPTRTEEWADAQVIHGISPEDVKDKETFDKHLPKINRIFNNAELLVGYNHEWFDIPFLKNAGVNIADDTKTFDVMHQFSPIYGQWDDEKNRFKWQKLSTCAEYYGYQSEGSFHDSLEDVRATLHCYQAMTNSKPDISAQKTQPSIKRTASRKTASIPHMTENLEK